MEQLKRAPKTGKYTLIYKIKCKVKKMLRNNASGEIKDFSFDFKFGDRELYTLTNRINGLVGVFCMYGSESEYS